MTELIFAFRARSLRDDDQPGVLGVRSLSPEFEGDANVEKTLEFEETKNSVWSGLDLPDFLLMPKGVLACHLRRRRRLSDKRLRHRVPGGTLLLLLLAPARLQWEQAETSHRVCSS